MISAIRTADRLKHRPLNTSLSLDARPTGGGSDGDEDTGLPGGINLGATLPDAAASPEEVLLMKDEMERLEAESVRRFSKLELRVWNEYKKGVAYTDIAKVLGRSPKTIDNALQRMKKKVAGALADVSA
jgi:RNA polymerase sporulation-specific sigma factor